jgi:arylsulfatase A-like enzyme
MRIFSPIWVLLIATHMYGAARADEASRPNILYIFTDDQSHRTVGCYPEAHDWVETPHLDALASAGLRFTHCYNGAWCQPSRASMLTGKLAHALDSLRFSDYPLADYDPNALPFWPARFRKQGYRTACIGKWHLGEDVGHGRDWDHSVIWDRGAGNAGAYYHDTLVRHDGGPRVPLDGYSTDRFTDLAVEYISRGHDRPWFLWLCYGGVHRPYAPAARHAESYAEAPATKIPVDIFGPRPTKPTFRQNDSAWKQDPAGQPIGFDTAVKKYHRAVRALDEGVGRLVDALRVTGQLQRTLVVYSSDQGFAWGQHGLRDKWEPYDASLRAPLICHWPEVIPAGLVSSEPVTGLDIVRTFHAVADIEPDWKMHGRDFSGLLRDPQTKWQTSPMLLVNTTMIYGQDFTQALQRRDWSKLAWLNDESLKGWVMMRRGRYKYIRYMAPDCIEELYDLKQDPAELNNLAVDANNKQLLLKLRDEAEEELLQCDGQFVAHLPKPRLRYGEDQYRVVRRFPIAEDPACMPAVTRAPNGDLLVAFSTQWEPFPAGGVLKLVVSEDNGRSWSQPRVLWQHEDPRVTIQVGNGLQTLSNGDVLLPVNYCLYPQRDDVPAGEQRPSRIYDLSSPNKVREVRLLRSADSGRSWTIEDPKIGAPWFGRLLETKVAETKETRLIMTGGGWYVESRDHGHTWGPRVSLGTPFYQETNLVQAADGTLFSILRQWGDLGPRRIFGTNFSRDGGQTWDKWRLTTVRGKMPDLLVLPSGRILMAVGMEGLSDGSQHINQTDRHSFVTLFISDDNGQTWQRDIALEQINSGSSVAPADGPGLCLLDDGKILAVAQALDRNRSGDSLYGYSAGMSIMGNVIEPAD